MSIVSIISAQKLRLIRYDLIPKCIYLGVDAYAELKKECVPYCEYVSYKQKLPLTPPTHVLTVYGLPVIVLPIDIGVVVVSENGLSNEIYRSDYYDTQR